MEDNQNRTERLFASVTYPDGKVLKIYQVITADELKKLVKMVEQGRLAFSNIAQAISAH